MELGRRGATVWLVGRRADLLAQVAADIGALGTGGEGRPLALDVTRDEGVLGFRARLEAEGAGVDILVHSAGLHALGALAEAPITELDALYATNVRAPYFLTQQLLPMLRARQGQVVFVNSTVGLQARAMTAAYSATKHALRGLADALRDEVNGDGVRVISVYAGRTATPRQVEIHAQEGKPYRPERLMRAEDVALVIAQALTTERTAEVTDIRLRPMLKS
jgi:NADP-dependent 3-hydroxy acid dehydrogenase YdfG